MKYQTDGKCRSRRRPRAFTLIELLVVISIIALLLSILMPALKRAKRQAQRTVCLAHVKSLALAGLAYSADNDSRFPHQNASWGGTALISDPFTVGAIWGDVNNTTDDSWVRNIFPYASIEKFFVCPGNKNVDSSWPPSREADISYCANGVISHFGGKRNRRHSDTVAYFDDPLRSNVSMVRPFMTGKYTDEQAQTMQVWSGWMRYGGGALHPQPHEGGRCYGFLDGHAVFAKWEDVTSLWMGLMIGPAGRRSDTQEAEVGDYRHPLRAGVIQW